MGERENAGASVVTQARLTVPPCPPQRSLPQLCPHGLHVLQHQCLPRSDRGRCPRPSSQEETQGLLQVVPGPEAGGEPEGERCQQQHRRPKGECGRGGGGMCGRRPASGIRSATHRLSRIDPSPPAPRQGSLSSSSPGIYDDRRGHGSLTTYGCQGVAEARVFIRSVRSANVYCSPTTCQALPGTGDTEGIQIGEAADRTGLTS